MTNASDIVVLMYGGPDRVESVSLTLRTSYDPSRHQEALRKWADLQPKGSVAVLSSSAVDPDRQAGTRVWKSRLWLATPDRSPTPRHPPRMSFTRLTRAVISIGLVK